MRRQRNYSESSDDERRCSECGHLGQQLQTRRDADREEVAEDAHPKRGEPAPARPPNAEIGRFLQPEQQCSGRRDPGNERR